MYNNNYSNVEFSAKSNHNNHATKNNNTTMVKNNLKVGSPSCYASSENMNGTCIPLGNRLRHPAGTVRVVYWRPSGSSVPKRAPKPSPAGSPVPDRMHMGFHGVVEDQPIELTNHINKKYKDKLDGTIYMHATQ